MNLRLLKEGMEEGIVMEFGTDMYTLLEFKKKKNQQGPTVYHINSLQRYMAAWMGGEFGENGYVYMYG